MDRIAKIFADCRAENRRALVMFVSCGCPTMAASETLIEREIAAGADIVELGVPFSDPMADGPVIQAASQRALAAGATLPAILEMAGRVRARHPGVGLILFSYFNVLFHYGLDGITDRIREVGIDGILPVDLPFEEREELAVCCRPKGLHLIPLAAPGTSPERLAEITAGSTGFLYYVTVRGVTGERAGLPPDLARNLAEVRRISPVPVVAGFGIASPESARRAAEFADGVVVGSAAVRPLLDESPEAGADRIEALVRSLAAALRDDPR